MHDRQTGRNPVRRRNILVQGCRGYVPSVTAFEPEAVKKGVKGVKPGDGNPGTGRQENGKRNRAGIMKDLIAEQHELACCAINVAEVYAGMRGP
jgi:hypothetical protein